MSSYMDLDLEKLQNKYQNLSRNDFVRMWRFSLSHEGDMKKLNRQREKLKIRGREHAVSVPLVQVLSVHVVLDENKPLAIYGRIYGEYDRSIGCNERKFCNVYNRGCDEPEIMVQNGNLTLTSMLFNHSFDVSMLLNKTTIVVDLWDADKKVAFCQGSFMVEEIAVNEYEQVKTKIVPGMFGYVIVRYIAMSFGTIWQVMIRFYHEDYKKEGNRDVVNVSGKIATRYDNTYGNYSSEEFTIFEKPSFEFEPIKVNSGSILRQSTYWIAVPAYSSLVVDFDLWDFDVKRNFLKETIKISAQQRCYGCYRHTLTADDLVLDVYAKNYHFFLPQVCKEENNHKSTIVCSDDNDGSLSNIGGLWVIHAHGTKITALPFVEFYSIFISHGKHKPLRIFGVIEASFGDYTFDIFRREENNAIELLEDVTSLPILDGNRAYEYGASLKIMVDLKDVEGRVFIKGFVKWSKRQILNGESDNEQLCSVIPGEHGFAALHYTFFETALQANIEVFYKIKNSCSSNVTSPLIYGSLVAKYDYRVHSSRHKSDYYQIVLFQRNQDDPLQVPSDMKLPLSRSLVVVPVKPEKPTLNIKVHLWSVGLLNKCLSHVFEIEVGCESISIDKEEFSLDIILKWSDGE